MGRWSVAQQDGQGLSFVRSQGSGVNIRRKLNDWTVSKTEASGIF